MLVFFIHGAHANCVAWYRDLWSERWRGAIRIVPYERIGRAWPLPKRALYVFTDVDRLSPERQAQAARMHRTLCENGARVLNDPRAVLRRYDLLAALHGAGLNRHAAWRVQDAARARYPLFLRVADEHDGPLTHPLADAATLARALELMKRQGHDLDKLIAVEYCETADAAGIRRKYAAFRIGAQIVPAHLNFSPGWVQKGEELQTFEAHPAQREEEAAYLRDNPHADKVMEIFRIARIDYGRIDYAMLDGRIETWEINTNPILMHKPEQLPASRIETKRGVAAALDAAFAQNVKLVEPSAM